MIADYLLIQNYYRERQHVIRAHPDMINEELEHPHTSTIILQLEEAEKLDDDVINDKLEHSYSPHFSYPCS